MPDDLPLIYWDACVFLSYVNGTPDRLQHIDAFLEKNGRDFQIVTSVISVVEVAIGKSEQDGMPLGPGAIAKIDLLWNASDSPIKLIEFHRLIADRARDLIRSNVARGLTGLKAVDAIHLATARVHGASVFHTYDRLARYATDIGFPVAEPISDSPHLPFTSSQTPAPPPPLA